MKTEYEVKILDIDVSVLEQKLQKLGATKVAEKFQQRYVYDFSPLVQNTWIRLRTNGTVTTLTIKEIHNDEVDGTKELETEVSDFKTTHTILQKLGYNAKSYQENKRVSYKLEDVEIEIDFWPRIPPYVEIEAQSKEKVEEVLHLLGYSLEDTTSMNTTKVYKCYGIDLEGVKELCFGE